MIRLALLRHGHTAWNREGRIQGRTDVPLDEEAVARLASLCLPEPWDRADLVASPLSRAVATSELVADRAPRIEPALTEMDWGNWEGQHGADLRAESTSGFRDIEDWGWHYTPPGGESPAIVRTRLSAWVDDLREDTLAVCHIGVMRTALALGTGWNFAGPAPFQIKRDRLYVLRISPDRWTLEPNTPRLCERQP